jgi:tungstate transport system substrate-binding protein
VVAAAACILTSPAGSAKPEPKVLPLATTTRAYDSGLLDAILPDFESKYDAWVDAVEAGTGQAIALGENGDADVILFRARARRCFPGGRQRPTPA